MPEELVEHATSLGYAALAITDECSMAGVVRAHTEARKPDLHLLIGSEFILEDGLTAGLPRHEPEWLRQPVRAHHTGAATCGKRRLPHQPGGLRKLSGCAASRAPTRLPGLAYSRSCSGQTALCWMTCAGRCRSFPAAAGPLSSYCFMAVKTCCSTNTTGCGYHGHAARWPRAMSACMTLPESLCRIR